MNKALIAFSLFCVLILSSCGSSTVNIADVSPNKKVNITVKAKRPSPMGTWAVELDVKAYDFKQGHLSFEVEATEMSDKTVKFDWQDDTHCLISFTLPDNTKRRFQLIADENQVQLAEVSL